MSATPSAAPHANNFGALRLFFAVLVILAHSFELSVGNRSDEPLTRLFHTISFGDLAVDGFFLISGYLIVKSARESSSALQFLFKRILRIYPGYIAAYLICLAISPWVGGELAALPAGAAISGMVFLVPPDVPGAFAGTHYPMLNGSMWTIGYEFRCYLLVLALWSLGILEKRGVLLLATAVATAVAAVHADIWSWFPDRLEPLLGRPDLNLTFVAAFGCGGLFYLYRDRIRYDGRNAALAGGALVAALFSPHLAEAGVAIFGGYLLFWAAFKARSPRLARIGGRIDLSYGVYLYAWPVQKLLIGAAPGLSPWLIFAASTAIAGLFAAASWRWIERPFLSLKTAALPRAVPVAASKA